MQQNITGIQIFVANRASNFFLYYQTRFWTEEKKSTCLLQSFEDRTNSNPKAKLGVRWLLFLITAFIHRGGMAKFLLKTWKNQKKAQMQSKSHKKLLKNQ